MKKVLFLTLFITSFFVVGEVFAAGTFQLNSLKGPLKAVFGQPYSIFINYYYSGDYISNASIVGSTLPKGMKLGSVKYGANGVDSIEFYGTPMEIGNHSLELLLTDNNGALLTKTFDFEVVDVYSAVTILTNSLPDGIINQPYSASIEISFVSKGSKLPDVKFGAFPSGIQSKVSNVEWLGSNFGKETIELYGTPSSAGQFEINIEAHEGGVTSNDFNDFSLDKYLKTFIKRRFTLNIIAPQKQESQETLLVSQPPKSTKTKAVSSESLNLKTNQSSPNSGATSSSDILASSSATSSITSEAPEEIKNTNTPTNKGFFANIGSFMDSLINRFINIFKSRAK